MRFLGWKAIPAPSLDCRYPFWVWKAALALSVGSGRAGRATLWVWKRMVAHSGLQRGDRLGLQSATLVATSARLFWA